MSEQQESLNYLIGNFVSTDTNEQTMNETNMVCIDTSSGYLGFNTIDPSYHIDVSGGTIRTDKLILNNIPDNSEGLSTGEIYHENGILKIIF